MVAQSVGIEEGSDRLLPVKIGPVDDARLPVRLRMLATLDLADPRRADRDFARLADALRSCRAGKRSRIENMSGTFSGLLLPERPDGRRKMS